MHNKISVDISFFSLFSGARRPQNWLNMFFITPCSETQKIAKKKPGAASDQASASSDPLSRRDQVS